MTNALVNAIGSYSLSRPCASRAALLMSGDGGAGRGARRTGCWCEMRQRSETSLENIDTIVLDKTGTLTEAKLVKVVAMAGFSETELPEASCVPGRAASIRWQWRL